MTELPHDRGAEIAIIGGILLDPKSLDVVRSTLTAEDFYIERHAHIYRAMCQIVDRSEPLDHVTVQAELATMEKLSLVGGAEYLAELVADVFTTVSSEHYATVVASHAERRRVHYAYVQAAREALDKAITIEDVVGRTSAKVTVNPRDKRGPVTLDASLERVWVQVQETAEGSIVGLPTYYHELDDLLQNLRQGGIYIVAARPSVGKTTFALNIATRMAQHQHKVLFFSLEQSHTELAAKVAGMASRMTHSLFRNPQALSSGGLTTVANAMERVAGLPLAIDDTAGITLTTLRSRARIWQTKHGLDAIVVDYLQLMSGKGEEYARVSENSLGLKILARDLNVPIILLSQLSRESERRTDHRPTLADLRSSGSIEQDADVVLALYREGLYKRGEDRSQTEILVLKNRHGAIGTLSMTFVEQIGLFRD